MNTREKAMIIRDVYRHGIRVSFDRGLLFISSRDDDTDAIQLRDFVTTIMAARWIHGDDCETGHTLKLTTLLAYTVMSSDRAKTVLDYLSAQNIACDCQFLNKISCEDECKRIILDMYKELTTTRLHREGDGRRDIESGRTARSE